MEELKRVHMNGLRALEAVGRLGSLKKAADELGVSIGAISQQVIKAEQRLDRKLFERRPQGLVLTEVGRSMLPRLTAGFSELAHAVASVRSDETALVISVAPVFASKWLVPRLAGFSRANPDLKVRLDASMELVNLDASDVDLAIRVGSGHWPGVRGDFLLSQEVFPICAPDLAASIAAPRDLLALPILRDSNSTLSWAIWLEQFGIAETELNDGHSFTDASLCLDAAIAGQGVMLAWQTLAYDALVAGKIVAPFPERSATGIGYWLVTSAERRKPERVRRFETWIRHEVALTAETTAL